MEVEVNRIGVFVFVVLMALALASGNVWAQATTAQISGTVNRNFSPMESANRYF
jgi:hypothetical protein